MIDLDKLDQLKEEVRELITDMALWFLAGLW